MTNEEILLAIKDIRNVFDTLGVECGLASRFSMDIWAQILQGGGNLELVNFVQTIQHKVSALKTLLNSIEVKRRNIRGVVISQKEDNFELVEQENVSN